LQPPAQLITSPRLLHRSVKTLSVYNTREWIWT